MKIFGVSRASAACAGAALFVWAQASAFCQDVETRPQMVVTKTDAYLIGSTQMLASANAYVFPHPQGRYALVVQRSVASMPGPLLGKSETGAVSLFLYDSRVNQTRLVFQRRADTAKHQIMNAWWLPQTNCALVIVRDEKADFHETATGDDGLGNENVQDAPPGVKPRGQTDALLFLDFEKNAPPRALVTSNDGNGIDVRVSPIKPFFLVETSRGVETGSTQTVLPVALPGNEPVAPPLPSIKETRQVRIGSAPLGTLGPARELPDGTYFSGWSASGTSVYETQSKAEKTVPGEKPKWVNTWYEWDGQSPNAVFLKNRPTGAMTAREAEPPSLPVALRRGALLVPAALKRAPLPDVPEAGDALFLDEEVTPTSALPPQKQGLPQSNSPAAKKPEESRKLQAVLHPLFLESAEASATSENASDHSALIAPDASYATFLADQSAILYQSGGALYAVPIRHFNEAAYAHLQKTLAQQKAQTIGKAILMYTQDYDDIFPLQNNFAKIVNPYVKDETMFEHFTYTNPNVPLGSIKFPATTVMGYLTTPGGRVVVYVDGHVQWQNTL